MVRSPRSPGLHGLRILVFGLTRLEGAMGFDGEVDGSPQTRLTLMMVGTTACRGARTLVEASSARIPLRLWPRKREVLRWTAADRRQADVATILGLSTRTIAHHLCRVRRRLGVTTIEQAVRATITRSDIKSYRRWPSKYS
jgi:DNA-binding CsgD family transcriptional regulator